MADPMVHIDDVSKRYRLGQIGGTTLYHELQRLGARIRHREDPTKRIGEADVEVGKEFLALDGVSFDVAAGERVGIIGRNGAGKSTVLKLISRVTAPTSGWIGLNGRVASMLEVGTGFHGELTGRENVYMNGAILGMTRREIDRKLDDIVEFSECARFIDTPVKRYSSGMYVKLAFSVAAHLDAEVMIMDEVLAVGDMAFQRKCLDKMADVSRGQGRTILYVSHNMATIRQLCDRVVVLDRGRVAFDGGVEEGIAAYMDGRRANETSYSYEGYARSPNESRDVELLGLEMLGRGSATIVSGETLEVVIRCRCNRTRSGVGLRLECKAADGSVVGTCFSDNKISAKAGDIVGLRYSIPTDALAPGRYTFAALLYEINGYGGQAGIDRVEPALAVEVVEGEGGGLTWLPQYWGHVRLGDMSLLGKETTPSP